MSVSGLQRAVLPITVLPYKEEGALPMNWIHQPLPKARRSELITREVAGDLLVYDRKSDQAHCLNPTAAIVWARCDGLTTVAEMAQLLEDKMNSTAAKEVIWIALEQLGKFRLLEEPFVRPARRKRMSRRVLMKHLGIAAAVSVPLVSSIVAPTAAAAASCRANGTTCTANSQCCSNSCVNNGRGVFQCA